MVMIPSGIGPGNYGYDGVGDDDWPPESAGSLRARLIVELTERLNKAASDDYVWPTSLVNKLVQCLGSDKMAQTILRALLLQAETQRQGGRARW